MTTPTSIADLSIHAELTPAYKTIFTDEAMAFINELVKEFQPQLNELLAERKQRQAAYDKGALPDFLVDTAEVRNSNWKIAGIPADLQDRRVEITGPVDRKMIINALNANVKVFMADFEDSQSPSWEGVAQGQVNLRDANIGTIEYTHPTTGKEYRLNDNPAVLICRVRGLHLPEKHITYQGTPIPGCLLDFGLYFYHNYKTRLAKGSGVYYYIPKLQSHQEAAWWSKVFKLTEQKFKLDSGTIKATVLIETLPAVFEMDEILYALKEHIAGLNCGRWDYIFSYIKTLKNHSDRVLPDRQQVTMNQPFLSAYSRLLIKTCHKRGAMAMGGMAAFIPSKDPAINAQVMEKVNADKTLEASNGHDGTWVAHPGLAEAALAVFDQYIPTNKANQLHVLREQDAAITAADLLAPCPGERTDQGMRSNIRVSLQYIEAWINGNGCVPIYGLMEDAATAEISRTSIWQWIQHEKALDNGQVVTKALFREMLDQEAAVVQQEVGEERWQQGRFEEAKAILDKITTSDELVEFLTLPAYSYLP
ncbi:malate synthase A [Endozoicomonas sp. SM1973]|uniref:Malate synthase n=1 Tax=Spartinivicinus marinus TaxID=2994442 RepID=A0A853ICK2_9GAMM|nr:malate synthase A [Spartinivicinus marinus]MCX4029694.1 malate synthase A [Spartinivicinus marinus]NYZ66925.1 malate synthase A [Spartinivicinus marinus]